jgi:hypothetical protein
MSYETKYLKYKSKYLELKARLAGNQMGGGANKKKIETETETTIRSDGNTLSESMDKLFKQLGGARAKSRSARSSRKASKKSSKKSRGSRRTAIDDSDLEEEDYDIMDKMLEDDDEDDFSSSDLDW